MEGGSSGTSGPRSGRGRLISNTPLGGRAVIQDVLRKIRDSGRAFETVLVVGLEEPPRRRRAGIGVQSNRREALELAATLGVKLQVFTLTYLTELEVYCIQGKRSYSHPTR